MTYAMDNKFLRSDKNSRTKIDLISLSIYNIYEYWNKFLTTTELQHTKTNSPFDMKYWYLKHALYVLAFYSAIGSSVDSILQDMRQNKLSYRQQRQVPWARVIFGLKYQFHFTPK